MLLGVPASGDPSPSTQALEKRMTSIRRCVADGKILDLTAGSPGQPGCVEACVGPYAERVVQAEGMAICLQPVVRNEPLDVSFTLMLRGVPWDHVPKPIALRNVLMAVAQALQVAPSEIRSQLLVRDADIYEDHELVAFEIRRQGEEYRKVPKTLTEPAGHVQAATSSSNSSLAARGKSLDSQLALNASQADSLPSGLQPVQQEDLWKSVAKRDEFLARSRFRGPCRNCDVFVAMRCEAWRISMTAGVQPANPLLQALVNSDNHENQEVEQQLGVADGWQVMQATLKARSLDALPLEAVKTLPAFLYEGYNWDQDPLIDGPNASRAASHHPPLLVEDFNGISQQSFGLGGPMPAFERAAGHPEVLPAEMFVMAMVFLGLYAASRAPRSSMSGFDNDFLFGSSYEAQLRNRPLRLHVRPGRRPARGQWDTGRELWDM